MTTNLDTQLSKATQAQLAAGMVAADVWVARVRMGMYLFVGYALSRHVPIIDAVAGTFVLMLFLQSVRKRGNAS